MPQVLLVHDSQLNAGLLDALLEKLESRGYRFISMDDALNDKAYSSSQGNLHDLSTCYLCWANRCFWNGDKRRTPSQSPRSDFGRHCRKRGCNAWRRRAGSGSAV